MRRREFIMRLGTRDHSALLGVAASHRVSLSGGPRFRTFQARPKDRLTLPLQAGRCGKPTKRGQPLAGL
jgi:hypothetical protein